MPRFAAALLLLSLGLWCASSTQTRADEGVAAAKEAQPAAPAAAETPKPAGDNAQPAADVVDQMLQKLQKNPMIEPAQRTNPTAPSSSPLLSPTPKVEVDPKVIGVAPGLPRPQLRREGEFVVNRRGRLVRSPNGKDLLFVFDADGKQAQEPPMIIVPCQILQSMEDLVLERGDKVVFLLSGQVLTYRGSNHLLPTMMKLSIDRGNLQN